MDTKELQFLLESGYREIHEVNGSVIAICQFMFTHAILADINLRDGCYERRWCYPSFEEALNYLRVWIKSDDPEPDGWIRRTHIKDEYPPGFNHEAGHRMSDVVNGRLVL